MEKLPIFLILVIAASVKSQSECPGELSIIPCICNIFDGRPSIECSQINDEDELENIFSSDFPDPAIQFFTLTNSNLPWLRRNVFGNVTFDDVYIRTDYLQEVREDAFANSEDTLRNLEIVNCPITENSFPFGSLNRYSELIQLTVRGNLISEFPSIVSDTIQFLFIVDNEYLIDVPSDAVATVTNITSLDLQNCGISTLEDAAFRGAEQLLYLTLRANSITIIRAALFTFLPDLIEINLSRNQIVEFAAGALTTMPSLVSVNLGYNRLASLDVGTFISNPELENIDFIYNEIVNIQPGTFDFLPRLQLLDVGYNNLSRLASETFRGVNVTTLYLDNNDIDYIESNAFGAVEEASVHLMDNLLTNLYEFWLKPVLDAENDVFLIGNPITCGCEISWIFEDPSYIEQISGRCANDTYFINLDPVWYQDNC